MGEREDSLCSNVALLKEQLISEQAEKERVGGALETTRSESGQLSALCIHNVQVPGRTMTSIEAV